MVTANHCHGRMNWNRSETSSDGCNNQSISCVDSIFRILESSNFKKQMSSKMSPETLRYDFIRFEKYGFHFSEEHIFRKISISRKTMFNSENSYFFVRSSLKHTCPKHEISTLQKWKSSRMCKGLNTFVPALLTTPNTQLRSPLHESGGPCLLGPNSLRRQRKQFL